MSEYKEKILNALNSVQREGIDKLIDYLESKTDYFTAPASTKYHCNYEGGLAEHSWKVKELFEEKNRYFNLGLSQDTIIICSLLHDLCKCNFYKKGLKNVKDGKKINGYGKEVDNWIEKEVWEIEDQLPLGHGSKSVILLQKFLRLSELEVMAILFHMGIPEEYEMKQAYNKSSEKYPAIITLHTADIESSYLLEKIIK